MAEAGFKMVKEPAAQGAAEEERARLVTLGKHLTAAALAAALVTGATAAAAASAAAAHIERGGYLSLPRRCGGTVRYKFRGKLEIVGS